MRHCQGTADTVGIEEHNRVLQRQLVEQRIVIHAETQAPGEQYVTERVDDIELHQRIAGELDGMRFNTAISAMMVFVNDAITWETKPVFVLREFLILLAPFAPHIAEELWFKVQSSKFKVAATGDSKALNLEHGTLNSLSYQPWPKFDPALLVESEIEIPVQVNGKLRVVIKVPADATQADLENAAKNSAEVKPFIDGKTIKKTIVVPKKLVNIVAI